MKHAQDKLFVRLVTADHALARRVSGVLAHSERFHVDVLEGRLSLVADRLASAGHASLLMVQLDPEDETELSALEHYLRSGSTVPPVIVLSDSVQSSNARRLFKMQLADWLPLSCSDAELLAACNQALHSSAASTAASAKCYAFLSAVGGAGATTLSIAAASVLARSKSKKQVPSCCIVDLNLQMGSVGDFLDLKPNLQIDEIAHSPDRLDSHLLEVMLSRRPDGLAVLAAQPRLDAAELVTPDLLGRLLDLASQHFDHLVFDMPRGWQPWSHSVLQGVDRFFIVTEMTVPGLRQAKRLADLMEQGAGLDTAGTVIVNKTKFWGREGVTKSHAKDALGARLSGFVADRPRVAHSAQNKGVLLRDVKRSNRIEGDIGRLLRTTGKST